MYHVQRFEGGKVEYVTRFAARVAKDGKVTIDVLEWGDFIDAKLLELWEGNAIIRQRGGGLVPQPKPYEAEDG